MLKYIASINASKAPKIQEIKTRAALAGPVQRYVDIIQDDCVIISNSKDSSYEISNISSWPLGREHAHIVNFANFDFTSSSTGTLTNLVDAASYFIDQKLTMQNEIWVAKVFDKVNFTQTKIVLSGYFSTSTYLAGISAVVTGDNKNGSSFMTPEMIDEVGT